MPRTDRSTQNRLFRTSLAALLLAAAVPAHALPSSDLFFSEYVEGSSFNKALEIYNATGSEIDLSAYRVEIYYNGQASPGRSITIGGNLAHGEALVLGHPSADAALAALVDVPAALNFNGDDSIALRRDDRFIDALGRVGQDPGTEWTGAGVGTRDTTLRRRPSVLAGDVDPFDPFDPALEWTAFGTDAFAGLGTHAIDRVSVPGPGSLWLLLVGLCTLVAGLGPRSRAGWRRPAAHGPLPSGSTGTS